MIRLKNISFGYGGQTVLNGLNLQAARGERLAITGPSGFGKTTLFRLISGLEKPSSGSIEIGGKVSPVFQEDRLLPWLTVRENIHLVNPGLSRAEIDGMLRAAGLEMAADKLPAELSGGMCRRTAILRALAFPHDILLLDEPFSGIDRDRRRVLSRYIMEKEQGKTLLLVSHDEEDAALLDCRCISLPQLMNSERGNKE